MPIEFCQKKNFEISTPMLISRKFYASEAYASAGEQN